MAVIKLIEAKTMSFREMRDELSTKLPWLRCDGSQGEVVLPYSRKVRTSVGIKESNYLLLTKAETIQVVFSDGSDFQGTATHKLCTSVSKDTWVTLQDAKVGDTIATLDGQVTIVSKEYMGVEEVADICVPGPHNYLLDNGVVSHNSLLGSTQLAINMATRGYKVVVVPLEMSKIEMTSRFIANKAGLDVTKILQRRLAKGEKELAEEKYMKWVKKIKKVGGRLTVFKPTEDLDIEEVFAAVNSYGPDVVIIDYISLLKGADSDDAWQKLGAMARLGKINAEATNRVNILLCQVSDEGKIRYARAISEHSTNSWVWIARKDERNRSIGRVNIEQPKARNSRSFPFDVGFEWASMRVVDVEQAEDVGSVAEPMKNLASDV